MIFNLQIHYRKTIDKMSTLSFYSIQPLHLELTFIVFQTTLILSFSLVYCLRRYLNYVFHRHP